MSEPRNLTEERARKLAERLGELQNSAREYVERRATGNYHSERSAMEALSVAAVRWTRAVDRARRKAR